MSVARQTAVSALTRLGVADQARDLVSRLDRRSRRNRRDNELLSYFMAATLGRSSNCVDIGANRGIVLQEMIRLAPDGAHLAFEPVPVLFAELEANHPDVQVHGIALADETGEAQFNIASVDELSGLAQRDWLEVDYDTVTVPVRRLDDVVGDRRVDFIKIDVEGAQVRVLRGAKATLTRDRPAIWLEHGDRSAAVNGTSTRDLWDLLQEVGYRIWTADGDGPLDWPELSATDGGPLWTFFAHP